MQVPTKRKNRGYKAVREKTIPNSYQIITFQKG